MGRRQIIFGGLLGGLTALVIIALNYLAFLWAGLPQTHFSLFDWLARVMPGSLITLVIDTIVSIISRFDLGPTAQVAKQAEQGLAAGTFVLVGLVLGIFLAVIGHYRPRLQPWSGPAVGLLLAVGMVFIQARLGFPAAGPVATTVWLLVIFSAWGWILAKWIDYLGVSNAAAPLMNERRQFLTLVGLGSVTVLVTAAGIRLFENDQQILVTGEVGGDLPPVSDSSTSGPARSPAQTVLSARIEPVTGTRPELTRNADFYRIDINTIPPSIDGESWRLEVSGLVEQPLELRLEDIRSRPSISQVITLECISNRLGGDLISTSLWTGVRLKDILEEAGLQANAQAIYIEAADGFYESIAMADAMDERTLLVYAMNNEPLPEAHGFPLRIYIPDRFGMKQPKWITRMEAIDHERPGYWVDRGWSETAFVQTTSVIDQIAIDEYDPQSETLPVGGIAYAGARGIQKVEIQVDDGAWQEVELRDPPLSPLTWVQWRYEWAAQPGEHTFRVRAYDGAGDLQVTDESEPHPAGATGIYSKSESIPRF